MFLYKRLNKDNDELSTAQKVGAFFLIVLSILTVIPALVFFSLFCFDRLFSKEKSETLLSTDDQSRVNTSYEQYSTLADIHAIPGTYVVNKDAMFAELYPDLDTGATATQQIERVRIKLAFEKIFLFHWNVFMLQSTPDLKRKWISAFVIADAVMDDSRPISKKDFALASLNTYNLNSSQELLRVKRLQDKLFAQHAPMVEHVRAVIRLVDDNRMPAGDITVDRIRAVENVQSSYRWR